MDEQALDAAMASGDLDALDALLDQYENGEEELDAITTPETTEKVESTATTAAAEEGDTSSEGNEDGDRVVLSKDGKHTIPYEVLENQRKRAQALEAENQQLKAIAAERDKLQAALDKNGIQLTAEEVEGKTDDELAELMEDFPAIGKVFAKYSNRINELEGRLAEKAQPETNAKNEVMTAFESIPELVSWKEGDQDRLDYAIARDAELMSDPIWQAKPVRERFQEAVRRTQSAFGDKVSQPAQQQKQQKQAAKPDGLPNSPSDLGTSVRETSTKGTPEYYASLSQSELQREMASMTPDAIDKLLQAMDY